MGPLIEITTSTQEVSVQCCVNDSPKWPQILTLIIPRIGYCLSAGTYKFTINDKFKDGMNAGDGGSYAGYVAGTKRFGSPSGESDWDQRVHEFSVGTSSGTTINSSEQFTAKIDTTDTDEQWLVAHNSRRKEWHTRYGKSYVPLQWSNDLEAKAEELLSRCGVGLVHGEISIEYSWNAICRQSTHILFRL